MASTRAGGSSNIASLLAARELGGICGRNLARGQTPDTARRALGSWTEADYMHHCSSQYVEFKPVPRSTIAASFSPNGKLLASTHGDHTVKVIDCFSGRCIKVLEGHTRTPWVVRFHPLDSDILASGSLDHRVVVWRVSSGEKLYTHDFGKPIATIAFHPSGKALVVASGHKVYFWDYTKPASTSRPNQNPTYILRTKRSLRALHFHPLGLPLILTAEVVDSKKAPAAAQAAGAGGATARGDAAAGGDADEDAAAESANRAAGGTHATGGADAMGGGLMGATGVAGTGGFFGSALSEVAMRVLDMAGMRLPGGLHAVARALLHNRRGDGSAGPASAAAQSAPGMHSTADGGQAASDHLYQHMARISLREATDAAVQDEAGAAGARRAFALHAAGTPGGAAQPGVAAAAGRASAGTTEPPPTMPRVAVFPTAAAATAPQGVAPTTAAGAAAAAAAAAVADAADGGHPTAPGQMAAVAAAAAAAVSAMERMRSSAGAGTSAVGDGGGGSVPAHPRVDLAMCDPWGMQRVRLTGGMETHAFPLEAQPLGSAYDLTWGWDTSTTPGAEASRSASGGALLESQLMPLAMTSEQPCVVNLNVWDFDHRRPSAILDKPRISVPRAVLCSEMGTQFSPCGRFLALCVAVDSLSDAGRRWQQDHVRRCMQRMRTAEGVRDAALSRYATGAAGPASGSGNGAGPSSAHAAPGVDVCTSADGAAAPDAAGPSCGVAAGAGQLDAPLQVVDTGDGFMLPVAQAWEVFPHDVQWLEFPAGTPQSEVDAAVQSAREAARLNKPLYELRVYSLDGATFGKVLCARLIRAAHCLTSVQFSPTSEHLLVAYGRRYISLCNLVAEGRGLVPAHTIVELHRTRDLEVVRMLPSLEDEVNVAAFHPVPGAGIVYGTKEGRLRSLRYDRRTPRRPAIPLAAVGERMDDELAAAEAGDARDGSDDEGDASGAHTGQR